MLIMKSEIKFAEPENRKDNSNMDVASFKEYDLKPDILFLWSFDFSFVIIKRMN